MNKKNVLPVIALAAAIALSGVAQTPARSKHHAVVQLTEPEGPAWNAMVIHVQNMREALAKDGGSEVEVVFFADGLEMLKKSNTKYEERLKKLADSGVVLAACQNAMRYLNLKTEDLFPFAAQVDSGVAELVRKQEAGWAYIH